MTNAQLRSGPSRNRASTPQNPIVATDAPVQAVVEDEYVPQSTPLELTQRMINTLGQITDPALANTIMQLKFAAHDARPFSNEAEERGWEAAMETAKSEYFRMKLRYQEQTNSQLSQEVEQLRQAPQIQYVTVPAERPQALNQSGITAEDSLIYQNHQTTVQARGQKRACTCPFCVKYRQYSGVGNHTNDYLFNR